MVGTKLGAVLRTVGLWILIVFDALLLFWLFATGNIVWLGVFTVITLWILAAEAWGMLIGYTDYDGVRRKMTISTNYKKYIQRVGWIGYVPLAAFWISMTGLILHLAVW